MVNDSDCIPKYSDSAAKSNQLEVHLVLYEKKRKKRRRKNYMTEFV